MHTTEPSQSSVEGVVSQLTTLTASGESIEFFIAEHLTLGGHAVPVTRRCSGKTGTIECIRDPGPVKSSWDITWETVRCWDSASRPSLVRGQTLAL